MSKLTKLSLKNLKKAYFLLNILTFPPSPEIRQRNMFPLRISSQPECEFCFLFRSTIHICISHAPPSGVPRSPTVIQTGSPSPKILFLYFPGKLMVQNLNTEFSPGTLYFGVSTLCVGGGVLYEPLFSEQMIARSFVLSNVIWATLNFSENKKNAFPKFALFQNYFFKKYILKSRCDFKSINGKKSDRGDSGVPGKSH